MRVKTCRLETPYGDETKDEVVNWIKEHCVGFIVASIVLSQARVRRVASVVIVALDTLIS